MGSSPRGTCVGSRYGRGGSFPAPFSWAPGLGGTRQKAGHSPLEPPLAITALSGLRAVSWVAPETEAPSPPTPRRRGLGLGLPRSVPPRHGNVNPFPLPGHRLRARLGPADPRLTNIAGEPWPFRRRGFPPRFAATTAGICTRNGSTGPHGPASAPPRRPPTAHPHGGGGPGSRRPA